MCGIYGYLGAQDSGLNERMLKSMPHRGPDDRGYFANGNVALGMQRLSIVDLKTGHQPIANEDETKFLVCNGEIYNALELREELVNRGHSFRTHSDSEVIIHLYEDYGRDCVHHLRGMFSFAILDGKKLFLARDRLGIKPLYYYVSDKAFVFASEIKGVLEYRGFTPEINFEKLYPHNYFDMGDQTHVKQVKEFLPSTRMAVTLDSKSGIQMQKDTYWSVDCRSVHNDEKEIVDKMAELLEESVKIHMRSDVPVGFMVSGGVDSNAVTACSKAVNPDSFLTFTFGNKKEGLNEFAPAGMMARKYYKSKHIHAYLNEDEVFSLFPKVMRALEVSEPRIFESSTSTYFLFREVARHVKVVMCGEGADELFGGYPAYFSPHYGNIESSLREYRKHMYGGLYRLQLKRLDKLSMAHSVEARVPFLDHKFFEYCALINPSLKHKDNVDKYIFRKMSTRYLPDEIAWRNKEQFTVGTGLSAIITNWLGGLSDKALNGLPLKNLPSAKGNYWNQSHSEENFRRYNLIVANLFYRIFIQGKHLDTAEDVFKN